MNRDAIFAVIGGFLMVFGATYAKGADLGKPAEKAAAVVAAPVPDQWSSWYVEGGAGGQFIKGGDKNLAGFAGIGWNTHALGNPWVVGAFLRYGFSMEGNSDAAVLTFDQPATLALRGGYLVAPSTLLYGIAGFSKSIKGPDFQGPILGLGAEAPILGSLRLAAEYTAQFDRDFKADRDIAHNIMLFARLPF